MILTAAHCVYNIVNPTDMEAFFGVSSKTEILNKARFMTFKVKVNLETLLGNIIILERIIKLETKINLEMSFLTWKTRYQLGNFTL